MLSGCRMVREANALGNARDTGSPVIPADADPERVEGIGTSRSFIAMADAQRHTEAWRDKPWKPFQRVVFRLQKRIYRASMVPMTRATCTEEPYDGNLSRTVRERQGAGRPAS